MKVLSLILSASLLWAADRRNTVTPNTDTPAVFAAPADRGVWETRRQQLRKQILSAAGLMPLPPKSALNPLIVDRLERNDYTIEKVALETLPGYWLGGNLYRPKAAGPHPAVLHPHGHWTYGRLQHDTLCSTPTLAINLARRGFVVFAYDMVGYNDTAQTPHDFSTPEFQLWSFTPLGLQLWNSIRAADFLETLPDVDSKRLAMTGASGGGTQTFLMTAVDDRIAVSAPVNMISGIMQGGCICENAPGLRVATNNIEIGAMMAPRPMLAVAATGDWTKNVPAVEYPALKKVWGVVRPAATRGSGASHRTAQLQQREPRGGLRFSPQAPATGFPALPRTLGSRRAPSGHARLRRDALCPLTRAAFPRSSQTGKPCRARRRRASPPRSPASACG